MRLSSLRPLFQTEAGPAKPQACWCVLRNVYFREINSLSHNPGFWLLMSNFLESDFVISTYEVSTTPRSFSIASKNYEKFANLWQLYILLIGEVQTSWLVIVSLITILFFIIIYSLSIDLYSRYYIISSLSVSYNKSTYSGILIGSNPRPIGGQTHGWRHYYTHFPLFWWKVSRIK